MHDGDVSTVVNVLLDDSASNHSNSKYSNSSSNGNNVTTKALHVPQRYQEIQSLWLFEKC